MIPDLRTISELNKLAKQEDPNFNPETTQLNTHEKYKKTNSGKNLNELWGVGAKHPLYHKDGIWYENLEDFPGALFDPDGYILFKTKKEYKECSYLRITKETNVKRGISQIPGYKRMKD